jgi:hypothetical protein
MVTIEPYVRGTRPVLPESQQMYLQDELKKLEKALLLIVEAIKDLDTRLATLEQP